MLTNDEINNIRSSVDIVEVIGRYIPLTSRGKNHFGVCPFHEDHSPSMCVSKEKQIYTCFSCHASGNVLTFLMDYEKISFVESLKMIADIAGIDVKLQNIKKNTNFNQVLFDIYETSNKFYQNNINTQQGIRAKEYLKKRHITDELIKEFEIGLSLKEKDYLTKLLLKKEYTDNDLIKSGLIGKTDYGYNDKFYNRIMFPIHDIGGKVVGYSGRQYEEINGSKYINTNETEIFKKRELLYNYYKAKDDSRLKNTIIIMEGFMDVIRAYSIGVKNVVATMGTAFTKYHIPLIKKVAKEVILCFDGDTAGQNASYETSKILEASGIIPKIIVLEEGLDPDDYIIKKGKESFLLKVDNPTNLMDFKLSYLKRNKDLTKNEDIATYINDVIFEMNNIDDEILKELILKKLSEETKLDISFIRDKLNKVKTPVKKYEPKVEVVVKKSNKYEKAEQNLIYYMLRSKEVIKMCDKKLTYMPDDNYRLLAREISCFYKETKKIDMADFYTMLLTDNSDLIITLGEIQSLNLKEEYSIEEIDDYINAIREYNIKYESNKLKEKIILEIDPTKKALLAEQIKNLKLKGENND